ncbi:endonuclease/exonuclease/phosphatase family protein [Streptomyces sp. NBC_00572]|uniref:endonuclease/exonuclease/phosphatase family protein n=1 Tax=Streptomyces sp. NBC_00572 TaxID=2903664 RepID=UPI00224E35D6|nr:endonuclease/exonuclease/phosphatase family protein [Streptomyces sp. NBC_00572]MCX4979643.1 endonuclease/exonuclease/phosphatase family protein [Streptomyces sp. NBC_00572]
MRATLRALLAAVFSVGFLIAAVSVPAQADVVDEETAPKPRFITYNVCGASSTCEDRVGTDEKREWRDAVVHAVDYWETDLVMLQEVCYEQWKLLRDHLATRSGVRYDTVWGAALPSAAGCARWDPDPNDGVAPDLRFGLAIFAKGGPGTIDTSTRSVTFLPEPTNDPDYRPDPTKPPSPINAENRILLCVKTLVTGRSVRACNTHIDFNRDNTTDQIAKVAAITRGFAAAEPVVLAGDFNQSPKHADMDPLYDHGTGSTGVFREVDENDKDRFTGTDCPRTADRCRSGEPTASTACSEHTEANKKIDYIFLSHHWSTTVRGDAVACSGVADHHLLRGAAAWEG